MAAKSDPVLMITTPLDASEPPALFNAELAELERSNVKLTVGPSGVLEFLSQLSSSTAAETIPAAQRLQLFLMKFLLFIWLGFL